MVASGNRVLLNRQSWRLPRPSVARGDVDTGNGCSFGHVDKNYYRVQSYTVLLSPHSFACSLAFFLSRLSCACCRDIYWVRG